MKIAIINSVAGISSKELAVFLTQWGHQAEAIKPAKSGRYDFTNYDVVFNYGYSGAFYPGKRVINSVKAVNTCIHKPSTFEAFKNAGVDTVEYCTRVQDIPKKWAWVVVRDQIDGRKAEGLNYYENIPGNVPNGALFSEYFEHKYEYRVVVFMEKVVGFYYKSEDANGIWTFLPQPHKGFEKMGEQAVNAAKALGIDYVGFDVVAKNKKDFRFLEANSAPVLTAEAMEAIYEHFLKA